MARRFLLACWGCLAALQAAGAETIHLKDGRTVEAQIIRQTDDTVTVDWYGVPLTYWRDGIVGIETGTGAATPATAPESGAPTSPPVTTSAASPPPVPPTELQPLTVFESRTRGARVAYPKGWATTVPDEPSPYVVVIRPSVPKEQAVGGQAPVVIELLKYAGASARFGLEASASGDDLVDRFLERFTEGGGRVLREEPLAVQGVPGWLVEAEGTDPTGVTHRMLLYLAAEHDVLAALFCQAPPEAFESYRGLYHEVINRLEPFVDAPRGEAIGHG